MDSSAQGRLPARTRRQATSSASNFEYSFRQSDRKITTYLLVALIVAAMAGWLGFIGWGLVVMLERLLGY